MRFKKGFTLVELLVSIALMTILITIMAAMLKSAQQMYDLSRIRAQITSNGRSSLDIIEKDMSRIIPLSKDFTRFEFLLRSKPYYPDQNEQENYLDSPYPPQKPSGMNMPEDIKANFLMAFFANAEYFIPAPSGTGNIRKFQVCRIIYYMKKRKLDKESGNDRPGAFLIRRLEPYYFDTITGDLIWEDPVEEDICSYVRGVRIWYLERNVDLETNDMKYIEAINQSSEGLPLPGTNLWEAERACVKFKMQSDWMVSQDPFEQHHFLPPSIQIQIHVVDDKALAYRIAQRIINIDVSPTVLPRKPGSW